MQSPKAPKEDPAARRARLREERIAREERNLTAQEASESLTRDYAAVYGMPSIFDFVSPAFPDRTQRPRRPFRTPDLAMQDSDPAQFQRIETPN